jgi:Rap1a immunity proteins
LYILSIKAHDRQSGDQVASGRGAGGSRGGAEERVKKIGMAAITVAALLSLSHARADDITGDIFHEDCIVARHGSGSDRDCDIYINGLAAGVLVDQVTREQGTPICFPPRIKAEQIRKVVEKFVQAHPDMLQVNGITIVGVALSDAFPCSKSN